MTPVDSLADPRVTLYRHVAQPRALEETGLFVVEGRLVVPRLLAWSAANGRWHGAAESVLLSPAAYEQMRDVVGAHPQVPCFVAPQAVVDGLVGFNMHRGCLALARRPPARSLTTADAAGALRVIVLEGVNNPDNIGGIFRSAAALGVDLIVLGPGCADPLYRKAVRTSMGAALEVPFVAAGAWPDALRLLRSAGHTVAALTTARDACPLPQWRPPDRVTLMAGAEAPGLSPEALAHADVPITVPMTGRVDSLNVATAVSIALYHVGVSDRT